MVLKRWEVVSRLEEAINKLGHLPKKGNKKKIAQVNQEDFYSAGLSGLTNFRSAEDMEDRSFTSTIVMFGNDELNSFMVYSRTNIELLLYG